MATEKSNLESCYLQIWNKVREVPPEAKTPIAGGRLIGKTDINPVWRIKKLTEIFGPAGEGWYSDDVSERTIQCGDEIVALVTLNLYVKYPEGWSKPIFGSGGSMLYAREKSGMFASDEAFKMAYTDALSVACKALGIAADVYFEKDKTKYTKQDGASNQDPAKVYPAKQEPPVDPNIALRNQIGKIVFPNSTSTERGEADPIRNEIYSRVFKEFAALNPKIKKLSDLNTNQLKDMLQKLS